MNANESQAVYAIASTVIMSFVYFIVLEKIKSDKGEKDPQASDIPFHVAQAWRFDDPGGYTGIGGMAGFRINPLKAGLTPGATGDLWPWLAGASILFITLNFFNSKNTELRDMYPELRLHNWTLKGLTIVAGGWILYLTGYEFLFRGLLLFSCYDAFGLWPAIVINLALYSALHLPKGMKEAIAAIPFGALICYLTIESQSILPAIFIHSLQAISCEIFCIYRNPGMSFHILKISDYE